MVAGDPQPVGFGEPAGLGRRAAVVVAAELQRGVAGVGQNLEGARHVELVIGQQIADGEHLDPDPVRRNVAPPAKAVILVVPAPATAVTIVGARDS